MRELLRIVRSKTGEESGVAFIMTLILLGVVGVLAAAYLTTSQATTSIAHRQLDQKRAFWAAEAGVEHMKSAGIQFKFEASGFELERDLYDGNGDKYKIVEESIKVDVYKDGNLEEEIDGTDILDYENEDININNNHTQFPEEWDEVVIDFESEGRYNDAAERIETKFIINEIDSDDPFNLLDSDSVFDEVVKVDDEDDEIEIYIDEDEVDIGDVEEDDFVHEILTDLEDNNHLDVDEDPDISLENGYFSVEYDITDSHHNQTEYMEVQYSLEGENGPLRAELGIEDGEIVEISYDEGGLDSRVDFHSAASDLDTEIETQDGNYIQVRDLFSVDGSLPDFEEDIFDDYDVVEYDGNQQDDDIDEFNNDDKNIIKINGDLTITGASSLELENKIIYVNGDITQMGGIPQMTIINSAFYVEGNIYHITGSTSGWNDWVVDTGSTVNPVLTVRFSDWRINEE